jgi:D-glycero-D-manno-heptose 1,7-bisphosphate phosphatase
MLSYVPERRRPSGLVPALIVDRDGVLNRRVVDGYVLTPDDLEPLDAAVPVLARASSSGVPVVIVSNQGCLARGLLDEPTLEAIHGRLIDHLASMQVMVNAIYVCPHHPSALKGEDRTCGCRKPRPGLLQAAARDLALDLNRSVFLGDQESDRAASHAAGIPPERFWLVDSEHITRQELSRVASGVRSALGLVD